MPASTANFNVSEIILAASQELRDNEFGRLGRPFYLSAAQRGLQEMNSHTNFHKAVWQKAIDGLIIDLPDGITEKDAIYLYNGDECDISKSTILWIKPNMYHMGGEGYLANNMGRNYDPLQWSLKWNQSPPNHLYFAGEHMGKLYLSPSCLQYQNIHITYTGIGVDCFGEEFEVPHWCREAITDFVILRAALAMEIDSPQLMGRIIERKMNEMRSPGGSWHTAIFRYKRSDKKTKRDTEAYNFRFGHTP